MLLQDRINYILEKIYFQEVHLSCDPDSKVKVCGLYTSAINKQGSIGDLCIFCLFPRSQFNLRQDKRKIFILILYD